MEENGEYGTIQNSEKKSLQGGLTKISFEKKRGVKSWLIYIKKSGKAIQDAADLIRQP